MSEQPLEHWPTERMVNEGHAEYAIAADLEDLSDEELAKVAEICIVNEYAPDECIPCLAHVTYLERQKQHLEDLAPALPEDDDFGSEDEERDTPQLDALMKEEPSWGEREAHDFIPVEVKKRPPVEILQLQVAMLAETLDDIVNGPPIPPKEVSLAELGLLVLAADKYVRMVEAQEIELSPGARVMLDSTRELVARLRPQED